MGKKKIHKRKNISSRYSNGTFIQTRDEYLDKTNYFSPGHENKNDFYRTVVIVDSNRDDELAIVPLTTHNRTRPKGTLSDYVYTKDSFGNFIKLPSHFFKLRRGKTMLERDLIKNKIYLFKKGPRASINRELVHKYIKKRK